MRTIIGLVGMPLAGKDMAAEHLIHQGFFHISTSDILRQEMSLQGIPTDRNHMQKFVTAAREKKGGGYLAEEAIKRVDISDQQKIIISGLRNTSEVAALRQKFGTEFVLMAVVASVEVRYERTKKRNRAGDDVSFEAFKAVEDAERKVNPNVFDTDTVIDSADFKIENSGTEAEFFDKIDACLKKIETK